MVGFTRSFAYGVTSFFCDYCHLGASQPAPFAPRRPRLVHRRELGREATHNGSLPGVHRALRLLCRHATDGALVSAPREPAQALTKLPLLCPNPHSTIANLVG